MKLFDFLKPKRPVARPIISNSENCGFTKTALIVGLFKVPKDKRDINWYKTFYQNLATASFACADPQLLTGPDGFPYFILKTPDENKPFESFCIQNMKDDFLLNRGWGVVFNPAKNKSADWVCTHGDIVNFHLNNEFFTKIEDAEIAGNQFTKSVEVITKGEKVLIAQPSESYLPRATRDAMKLFLQSKGIKTPKLMMLTFVNDGKLIRKLAFNIDPKNYPDKSQLDYLMQQVSWFLPNHYILVPLSQHSEWASDFHNM